MACKHERLRTVGHRVFCCSCGEELPLEALTGVKAENQPVNAAPVEKTDKAPSKKGRPKKAV